MLEKSKPAVLVEPEKRQATKINPEPFLFKKTGHLFFNTSPLDMKKLMGDQDHIKENPIRFSEWLLFSSGEAIPPLGHRPYSQGSDQGRE